MDLTISTRLPPISEDGCTSASPDTGLSPVPAKEMPSGPITEVARLRTELYECGELLARALSVAAVANARVAEVEAQGQKDSAMFTGLRTEWEAQGNKYAEEISALRVNLADTTAAVSALEVEQKKRAEEAAVTFAAAKVVVDTTIAELQTQGKKDAEEMAALRRRVAEVEGEKKGVDSMLNDAKAEIARLTGLLDESTTILLATEKELAGTTERLTSTSAESATLQAAALDAAARAGQDADDIASLTARIALLEAQVQSATGEYERAELAVAALKTTLSEVEAQARATESALLAAHTTALAAHAAANAALKERLLTAALSAPVAIASRRFQNECEYRRESVRLTEAIALALSERCFADAKTNRSALEVLQSSRSTDSVTSLSYAQLQEFAGSVGKMIGTRIEALAAQGEVDLAEVCFAEADKNSSLLAMVDK
jgi:chromosome segregation ATPase